MSIQNNHWTGIRPIGDFDVMMTASFHIHVEQIDPSRNRARFYALSIEPCLFGLALVRRWGRIGTRGREKIEPMDSEREAMLRFLELAALRRRHGYRACPPANSGAPGA